MGTHVRPNRDKNGTKGGHTDKNETKVGIPTLSTSTKVMWVRKGLTVARSRILNIDNTGHMVLRKRGGDEQEWEQELDILPQRKPTMRRPRRKSIFDTGEDDL